MKHAPGSPRTLDGRCPGTRGGASVLAAQAAAIVAMVDGTLLEWHRWGGQLDGASLARAARSLILGGVKGR